MNVWFNRIDGIKKDLERLYNKVKTKNFVKKLFKKLVPTLNTIWEGTCIGFNRVKRCEFNIPFETYIGPSVNGVKNEYHFFLQFIVSSLRKRVLESKKLFFKTNFGRFNKMLIKIAKKFGWVSHKYFAGHIIFNLKCFEFLSFEAKIFNFKQN